MFTLPPLLSYYFPPLQFISFCLLLLPSPLLFLFPLSLRHFFIISFFLLAYFTFCLFSYFFLSCHLYPAFLFFLLLRTLCRFLIYFYFLPFLFYLSLPASSSSYNALFLLPFLVLFIFLHSLPFPCSVFFLALSFTFPSLRLFFAPSSFTLSIRRYVMLCPFLRLTNKQTFNSDKLKRNVARRRRRTREVWEERK